MLVECHQESKADVDHDVNVLEHCKRRQGFCGSPNAYIKPDNLGKKANIYKLKFFLYSDARNACGMSSGIQSR